MEDNLDRSPQPAALASCNQFWLVGLNTLVIHGVDIDRNVQVAQLGLDDRLNLSPLQSTYAGRQCWYSQALYAFGFNRVTEPA